QYVEGLINGHDKGRIWRIQASDPPKGRTWNLSKLDVGDLVAELASPVVWRPLTAQRLLLERCETKAIPALKELCVTGTTPQARLHALYSLEGLNALEPELVVRALGDEHYGVRVHALRLSERWLDKEPGLFTKVAALAGDIHPKVRLQLACSLGTSNESKGLEALPPLPRPHRNAPSIQPPF